jgi:uncharacterized protein YjbI with pentapeptide repeats
MVATVATTSGERIPPRLPEEPSGKVTELDGEVDLTDTVVSGDLSGCELIEPVFSECRFEHGILTGSTLRYGRFVDCVISDCDLSGTILDECAFTRVEFRSCRASGLQAPHARLIDVGFSHCKLQGANFRRTVWERAELSACDLREADLYEAQMPGSRILNSDLSQLELTKADLTGSRLAGSNLDGLRGAGSLRKITITSDEMIPMALAIFKSLRITVTDEP